MSLDKAIADAMVSIPECVAGGYVDMTSGMLLGVKTIDSHPQEILDMVAATTADLFEGQNIRQIEQAFAQARGIKSDHLRYFQEVMVFSENLLHIFMRSKKQPDHVLVFVCRRNANVGMVLTKSRMALENVAAAL